MNELTIVFEYHDEESLDEAERLFNNGAAGDNLKAVYRGNAVGEMEYLKERRPQWTDEEMARIKERANNPLEINRVLSSL